MTFRRPLLASVASLIAAAKAPGAFAQPGVDRPQPRLPTERMVIVTRDGRRLDFTIEMALTPDQQTIGLLFRSEV
jgi:hypothetical protein